MKIAIIGRNEILYNTALALKAAGHNITCILTAKEAPEYTRKAIDFRQLACDWDIPFAIAGNTDKQVDFLHQSDADIAVSMNYTGVIPQTVIDLFPLGILNAHPGDLPRYRGNACPAWAIINGEDRIGVCVHKMIGDELDSGDIIERDYMQIDLETKITEVWEWLEVCIPSLMLMAVERLRLDSKYLLEEQSKDPNDALRCYPRRPEDGHINWNQTSVDVLRLINASNKPYSGAYTYFSGEKLIIWDAALSTTTENFCAVPGQVLSISNGSIEICCGTGRLKLILVEYQGRVDEPNSFIKSIRTRLE